MKGGRFKTDDKEPPYKISPEKVGPTTRCTRFHRPRIELNFVPVSSKSSRAMEGISYLLQLYAAFPKTAYLQRR